VWNHLQDAVSSTGGISTLYRHLLVDLPSSHAVKKPAVWSTSRALPWWWTARLAISLYTGDHHQQRRQCSLCCKARATFGHNVCSPFLRADRPDRAPRTLWTSEHGQSSVSRFSGDSASLSALPVLCALACRPVAAGRCAIHQNWMHWRTDANDRGRTRCVRESAARVRCWCARRAGTDANPRRSQVEWSCRVLCVGVGLQLRPLLPLAELGTLGTISAAPASR
jgi:hypothetical protein